MHFFRTCHLDSFLGQLGESQGFIRILPLMKEYQHKKGEIVARQGEVANKFFILKTGHVQVHTEIQYHVFNIQALGPS